MSGEATHRAGPVQYRLRLVAERAEYAHNLHASSVKHFLSISGIRMPQSLFKLLKSLSQILYV